MRHLTIITRVPRLLAATLVAFAVVAGTTACGPNASAADVRRVVGDSARAGAAATRLSHGLMREWCPDAAERHGRDLRRRRARRCLARARRAWLAELRRGGFGAKRVGGGP